MAIALNYSHVHSKTKAKFTYLFLSQPVGVCSFSRVENTLGRGATFI